MALDLETRVRRLEAANRRLRVGLAAAAVSAIVVASLRTADAKPDATPKIKTQGLELVDGGGKTRGRLGVEDDGAASLTLFDGGAGRTAVLTVSKTGHPALLLRNPGGKAQLIASLSEGGPVLDLCDAKGNVGCALTLLDEDGTSLLGMRLPGEERKGYRAVFTLLKDGRAYAKFVGPEGEMRIWGKPELEFRPTGDGK